MTRPEQVARIVLEHPGISPADVGARLGIKGRALETACHRALAQDLFAASGHGANRRYWPMPDERDRFAEAHDWLSSIRPEARELLSDNDVAALLAILC